MGQAERGVRPRGGPNRPRLKTWADEPVGSGVKGYQAQKDIWFSPKYICYSRRVIALRL